MQSPRASLSPRQWKSWRDVLPIHPAAELFPLMAPDELKALSEDIKKNGIQTPITVMYERIGETGEYSYRLMDGRNRLDGIERADFNTIAASRSRGRANRRKLGMECGLDPFLGFPDGNVAINYISPPDDPYAFVASANIHRRHLSAEQKRDLIAKLLKVDPSKSDRQIAEMTKTDHNTVGSERTEMEGRGEIPHVAERRDARGRKQPARKQPSRKSRKLTMKPQGTVSKPSATTDDKPQPRDDIGPDSAGEANRLRARNEELARENRRLARENLALRSEIEELKAELAKRAPIDDGLDMPAAGPPAPATERGSG